MSFPQVISGVKLTPEDLEEIYGCRKKLNPTVDTQTIMFWNLQLQFFNMKHDKFIDAFHAHIGFSLHEHLHYSHEELATELALQLSGLK